MTKRGMDVLYVIEMANQGSGRGRRGACGPP